MTSRRAFRRLALVALGACAAVPTAQEGGGPGGATSAGGAMVQQLLGSMMLGLLEHAKPSSSQGSVQEGVGDAQQRVASRPQLYQQQQSPQQPPPQRTQPPLPHELLSANGSSLVGLVPSPAATAAGALGGPGLLPPPEEPDVQWTTLSGPAPTPTPAPAVAPNATWGGSGAAADDRTLETVMLVVLAVCTLLFLVDCCGPEASRLCCRRRRRKNAKG